MEKYFRKYYQSLCYFAMNIVHDESLCEDIVQEVFVKAISSQVSFESELHFRQYIYIAVRNRCINHLQKQGRTVGLGEVDSESTPAADERAKTRLRELLKDIYPLLFILAGELHF